jgi:Ca-activated chloride channel family protein
MFVFAKFTTAVVICIVAAQPYMLSYSSITVTPDNVLLVNATATRLMVLLDISTSMGYADTHPSRISNAMGLVEKMLAMATSRGDRVDVYGFSDAVKPLCTAVNSSTLDTCMARLRETRLERYSAVGDAIIYGYTYAMASHMPTAALIVTDGASNYGSPIQDALRTVSAARVPLAVVLVGNDPRSLQLEEACREHGVVVYRVAIGPGEDEALKYVSERLYANLRFKALAATGNINIKVPTKDYSIQLYLLALLVPLFLLSLAEGL